MASYKDKEREGQKLEFELFKHVTTLSTATPLIMLALAELLNVSLPGIAVALGFLVASVISSLRGMANISTRVYLGEGGRPIRLSLFTAATFVLGLIAYFFLGLILPTLVPQS